MIEKEQIAEAVRYADAEAEEHGFDGYMRRQDIDPFDLMYVAEQRAMRVCMILDGHNPNITHHTEIRLSKQARELLPLFQTTWADAFNAGMSVRRTQDAA